MSFFTCNAGGARRRLIGAQVLALAFAAGIALPAWAAEFVARSGDEVTAAMSKAGPGDVVVLENGVWRDQLIEFAGDGAPNRPIVMRARTPGGVRLEGNSRLEISGRWLQVEGLRFESGALTQGDAIVRFRGRRGDASNSRFTNSAIVRYNPPDPKTHYAWVALYGHDNRVDHNRFEGQNHAGVTLVVFHRANRIDNHRIEDNHFLDRPVGDGNGFETIRIGASPTADSVSATRVERNLFERTDGEVEAVSVKSGGNVIRENTFREVAGTVTLRHGNGNTVEQNYFLGGHKPGTGGIRVTGEDQVVRDNLLQELAGRVGGIISLMCGRDKPGPEVDYEPLRRLELRGNVIADSDAPAIKLDAGCGAKREVRPSAVTMASNLVSGQRTALSDGEAGKDWSWNGNLFDGAGDTPIPTNGVSRSPGLLAKGSDGIWRSPQMQGKAGPKKRPLTSADVGPSWWK